jgi:hypothetical protein
LSPIPGMGLLRSLLRGHTPILIDFPPRPRARWGQGRPAHEDLRALLDRGRAGYRDRLGEIVAQRERLAAIPVNGSPDTGDPYWVNGFLPGLDAAALYTQVARRAPRRYVEIGSGHSTRFAARAIRDGSLATRIVCYDPAPRASVAGLAHEVHRARLEDLPAGEIAAAVGAGDILFYDGSHRAFENSDVTVFFLEVLPQLPAGVLVQVHDICLPYDYPAGWEDRWYSEQYVLAAWLLGGGAGLRIVLPNAFASQDAELTQLMEPLWTQAPLAGVERHGSSFWMETTGA